MAPPIVIYGKAVQEARNRLRSAQISTMVEILRYALFAGPGEVASNFAEYLQNQIKDLPEPVDNPKALAAMNGAKNRIANFVTGGSIHDVFAVGDVLRYVGEYIEFGGAPKAVFAFEDGLRNKTAFSTENRTRESVPGFLRGERPDLGIFKFRLTDRSVVKYMERFYGPYLGADISGTTTDSLAALAFILFGAFYSPDQRALGKSALHEIRTGHVLVPIATMVLQYYHSLLECGLALALTSPDMPGQRALRTYNFYDYSTLANGALDAELNEVLENGNQILDSDLGGRGLVILRDFIDIQKSAYVDCEIGLLVDQPRSRPLFTLNDLQYQTFASSRARVLQNDNYIKGNPSLISIAVGFADTLEIDPEGLRDLANKNEAGLRTVAGCYSNLDQALKAGGAADTQATPSPDLQTATPAATPTLAATAPPSSNPSSAITSNQIQDLKKALAIVQLLEGAGRG